jgi:hypothetical protein
VGIQSKYAGSSLSVPLTVFQAMADLGDQLHEYPSIGELIMVAEDVYSFVDAIQAAPSKIVVLEDIIAKILKQTFECFLYIREYLAQHTAGMLPFASTL